MGIITSSSRDASTFEMNPYAPDVAQTHSTSAPSNYNSCFAIVAFSAYVAFMMINRGAVRVLDEYAHRSLYGAIEVGIVT